MLLVLLNIVEVDVLLVTELFSCLPVYGSFAIMEKFIM